MSSSRECQRALQARPVPSQTASGSRDWSARRSPSRHFATRSESVSSLLPSSPGSKMSCRPGACVRISRYAPHEPDINACAPRCGPAGSGEIGKHRGDLAAEQYIAHLPLLLRGELLEEAHFARGEERDRHAVAIQRSEEHTSELQSRFDLVCRLLLEKKKDSADSTKKVFHGE